MKLHEILGMRIAVSAFAIAAWSAEPIRIVHNGQPRSVVAVRADAERQTEEAARLLVEYVRQSSGAELPIVTGPVPRSATQPVVIQVGRSEPVDRLHPELKELDEDGFVIHGLDSSLIIIAGPTPYGTEFGVCEFLERYVGVRWLMPGPDGDDVPAHTSIDVPVGQLRQEPAFFSRQLSGLRGDGQQTWARRNRMHGRVSFHHNLLRVFPPETYTRTHPGFFPMKDGTTRFLPPTNSTHGWQPCFTADGLVEEAVKRITRYLDQHPGVASFSLGVNDSSGHCRCPDCLTQVPEEPNFLGRADYSDVYYDWCNRVIDGVLRNHPHTWFGCLAYSEVAAPPTNVKIHERLIPFMTYDRMKWIHPEVEAAGQAATEAWEKAGPTLGWYDYIYGTPYCVPRVYFHKAQEYIRYGHAHGVRAWYAEIYPNWGEGPKPYVYLKLWWNPRADVDALLSEWYERCVGSEAAPYLAAYYAIWERFWTKDILDSAWFSTGGQYLRFGNPAYLGDVKREDVIESRRLLNACIATCRTDKQRARATLLEKAFQYYEASALAYLADGTPPAPIVTEAQALAVLNNAETATRMAEKRRHLALEVYPRDPVLVHPLTIQRFGALSGETWGGTGLWAAMGWLTKDAGVVRTRVNELATRSESDHVRAQTRLMLAIVDGTVAPISKNASFEQGDGNRSAHWSYWVKPDPVSKRPVGRILRSAGRAHDGEYALLCHGMYRGGPVQTIRPLLPGTYCAVARVYVEVPEPRESKGTCELVLTPRGADGRNLPGFSTTITPPPGAWSLIVAGGTIEERINDTAVTHALLIPIINDFRTDAEVYWDEVALYRVEQD
jgi:hypothetical protein